MSEARDKLKDALSIFLATFMFVGGFSCADKVSSGAQSSSSATAPAASPTPRAETLLDRAKPLLKSKLISKGLSEKNATLITDQAVQYSSGSSSIQQKILLKFKYKLNPFASVDNVTIVLPLLIKGAFMALENTALEMSPEAIRGSIGSITTSILELKELQVLTPAESQSLITGVVTAGIANIPISFVDNAGLALSQVGESALNFSSSSLASDDLRSSSLLEIQSALMGKVNDLPDGVKGDFIKSIVPALMTSTQAISSPSLSSQAVGQMSHDLFKQVADDFSGILPTLSQTLATEVMTKHTDLLDVIGKGIVDNQSNASTLVVSFVKAAQNVLLTNTDANPSNGLEDLYSGIVAASQTSSTSNQSSLISNIQTGISSALQDSSTTAQSSALQSQALQLTHALNQIDNEDRFNQITSQMMASNAQAYLELTASPPPASLIQDMLTAVQTDKPSQNLSTLAAGALQQIQSSTYMQAHADSGTAALGIFSQGMAQSLTPEQSSQALQAMVSGTSSLSQAQLASISSGVFQGLMESDKSDSLGSMAQQISESMSQNTALASSLPTLTQSLVHQAKDISVSSAAQVIAGMVSGAPTASSTVIQNTITQSLQEIPSPLLTEGLTEVITKIHENFSSSSDTASSNASSSEKLNMISAVHQSMIQSIPHDNLQVMSQLMAVEIQALAQNSDFSITQIQQSMNSMTQQTLASQTDVTAKQNMLQLIASQSMTLLAQTGTSTSTTELQGSIQALNQALVTSVNSLNLTSQQMADTMPQLVQTLVTGAVEIGRSRNLASSDTQALGQAIVTTVSSTLTAGTGMSSSDLSTIISQVGTVGTQTQNTLLSDTTPPAITQNLVTPSTLPGLTVFAHSFSTLNLSSLTTDANGVTKVTVVTPPSSGTFSCNGLNCTYTNSPANNTTPASADSVVVKFSDPAGNLSASVTLQLTISSTDFLSTTLANNTTLTAASPSDFVLQGQCSHIGDNVVIAGTLAGTANCLSGGGSVGYWTKTFALSSLPEGTVTVQLSHDQAPSLSRTVIKDTVAPTISGVVIDTTPHTSKIWSWSCVDSHTPCTYRFVVDTNASATPSGAYGSTATASQNSGSGTYYLHVQAKDAMGNESTVAHISAIVDSTPPTLLATVGAPSAGTYKSGQNIDFILSFDKAVVVTGTPKLTLTLGSATKYATYLSTSGTQAIFRYTVGSGDNDTNGIAMNTRLNLDSSSIANLTGLTLATATVDSHTVAAVTLTAPPLTSVLVDTTAPVLTGLSNSTTGTKSKTWSWGCTDNISTSCTYRYIIDTNATTTPSGNYISTLTATQSTGTGTYYLHIQAKDTAGNESTVSHISALLDNTAPTGVNITIAGGDARTRSAVVNLNFPTISDVSEMYITNAPQCLSGGTWEAYASSKPDWTLAQLNSQATVYAKFRDAAGNESSCVSDTIIQDKSAPPICTLSGAPTGTSAASSLNVTVAGTDVVSYFYALGVASTTNCATATYSSSVPVATHITNDLTALAEGDIRLCVKGADSSANLQYTATEKVWTKMIPTPPSNLAHASTFGSVADSPAITWTASTDSNLSAYLLAIGTTAGATNVLNWTNIGNTTTYTAHDLNLTAGATYYVSLKTLTSQGFQSSAIGSTGWTVIQAWTHKAYIKAPNSEPSDKFGNSVAIDGDTLAVGSAIEGGDQTTVYNSSIWPNNNNAASSGAVYVYKRTGSTWAFQAFVIVV